MIHALGTIPRCEIFPEPHAGDDEVVMTVKASALKQLDKSKVSGKHYTTFEHLPAVAIQALSPIDIIIDYLWGRPVELLLTALKKSAPHRVRIVTVGEMAGPALNLPSALLRSLPLELLGSGIGSISRETINEYMKKELPYMFGLVTAGQLKIDVETAKLEDIEAAWQQEISPGKRLVITI